MKNKYIIALISLAILFACEPKINEFQSNKGTADFTTYIALGNSLTAGFASNALSQQGQIYSYPNMLARKFKTVGMQREFKQPLMPLIDGKDIGISSSLQSKLILGLVQDGDGGSTLSPVPADPTADPSVLGPALVNNVFGNQGPFNNFGVPGAKAGHLLFPGYGNMSTQPYNPYFVRFASTPDMTILADAMAQNPTFFTLWIGNNDVLNYATSGGIGDIITDNAEFSAHMTNIITNLTLNGAKGAVANIPEITSIPFFTTVPYNALILDETKRAVLQEGYIPVNAALKGLGKDTIKFVVGPNPFIIEDASEAVGRRQIKPDELVLLSISQADIKNPAIGLGSSTPIPSQYVLTTTEIDNINQAITNFNIAIKQHTETNENLILVNMFQHMRSLKSGLTYDGISFSTTFVTGDAFSLDGVHLNPRGYAVVANFFIDAINAGFGANVPKVNVTEYPGLVFP
jgi:lysophospholipase L1-like esterase